VNKGLLMMNVVFTGIAYIITVYDISKSIKQNSSRKANPSGT